MWYILRAYLYYQNIYIQKKLCFENISFIQISILYETEHRHIYIYMASWLELLGFMGPQINSGGMIQYSIDSISNDTHTILWSLSISHLPCTFVKIILSSNVMFVSDQAYIYIVVYIVHNDTHLFRESHPAHHGYFSVSIGGG